MAHPFTALIFKAQTSLALICVVWIFVTQKILIQLYLSAPNMTTAPNGQEVLEYPARGMLFVGPRGGSASASSASPSASNKKQPCTKDNYKKFIEEGCSLTDAQLPGVDFRNLILKGVSFAFSDLTFSNFNGMDLTGANFSGASLQGADFRGAKLANVDFTGATYDDNTRFPEGFVLEGRDMVKATNNLSKPAPKAASAKAVSSPSPSPALSPADTYICNNTNYREYIRKKDKMNQLLRENGKTCDLKNVTFPQDISSDSNKRLYFFKALLPGAKFDNLFLKWSNFFRSDLKGATFKNANLFGAYFKEADLEGVDFAGADLTYADFRGAKNINQAIFDNVVYSDSTKFPPGFSPKGSAKVKVGSAARATLKGITQEPLAPPSPPPAEKSSCGVASNDFRGRIRDKKKIQALIQLAKQNCDLRQVQISKISFNHRNFRDLTSTNFSGATLQNASFFKADLTGAKFQDSKLPKANFERATLKQVDFTGAKLQGANFKGVDLSSANLAGAYLQGAKYNLKTTFPEGFDPKDHGMKLIKASTGIQLQQGFR